MAMGTDTAAALTRASRKLKQLGEDAISIPTTQELYDRKSVELRDARDKLADIVARLIKVESQSKYGEAAALLIAKKEAEKAVERLQNEAGLLKAGIIAQRPKPPMSPENQMWADAFAAAAQFDPYHRCKRGTPEQIAAAREAVAELVREERFSDLHGNARGVLIAKLSAARTRLTALIGPPYPPWMPWASRETLAAARKAEGLE